MIASSCQASYRSGRVGNCDLSADLKHIRAGLIETVDNKSANAGTKQEFALAYASDSLPHVPIRLFLRIGTP
jgi:hypothetical protein